MISMQAIHATMTIARSAEVLVGISRVRMNIQTMKIVTEIAVVQRGDMPIFWHDDDSPPNKTTSTLIHIAYILLGAGAIALAFL